MLVALQGIESIDVSALVAEEKELRESGTAGKHLETGTSLEGFSMTLFYES